PVEVAVTAVSQITARFTVQDVLDGKALPIPSDGALLKEDWGGKPALRLRDLPVSRFAVCGDLKVQLSISPLTLRLSTKAGDPIQELIIDEKTGSLRFSLGNGPLLGLGQGGPQFDRRGSFDRMASGQGGYRLGTNGGRVPIQLLIGTSGWGLFVHQPLGNFDLTGQDGLLQVETINSPLPLDVFVIGARDPQGILAEYSLITGYPEMIPLWSLGYQQSHRTLGSPREVIQEAKTFREKRLPCDAMIYLGTGFCPEGWNIGNGEFAWNSRMFPEPQRAIDQLHAEHFKVVPHIVVEGERLTGTVHDLCTAPPLPSGRTPDGHWPPDRQVSCYWPAHRALFDLNVDGWWPDQGDGFDAASRLARNRMYFEGSQMYRPNERVFALHRNGYAGMQRYAAFLWSGDVQSTWETLKVHVSVGINAGLSGIPYWGTDIGGFVPTKEYTGELFARWFQFAAFNPLFRSHGRDWRLHLPWGWTAGEIGYPETAGYQPDQSVLHNPAIEPICKKYLELRYQMMPYLYSVVKQTCTTGLPIIRALWLHYPDDPTAVARGDEYLYGRDILVAPVVEKDATSRILYLPHGNWYDFWTREKLEGGREVRRNVDLETIPLYCRAGAIIPLGPIKQYTEEKVDAPLTLSIYPGADGQFSLYEDDGKTFDYRNGEFTQIDISWNDRRRRLSLRLAVAPRILDRPQRRFAVQVIGQPGKREILFEGNSSTFDI
ncbi:MAG: TIM-barrel domain-containing protein, partial [Bryobacteraceae bacterium]